MCIGIFNGRVENEKMKTFIDVDFSLSLVTVNKWRDFSYKINWQ